MITPEEIVAGINVLAYLSLFVFIIINWKRNKTYALFFITILFGFAYITCSMLEMVTRIPFDVHKVIISIDFILAPWVAYWFVLFCLHFPKKNLRINIFYELAIAIPIIFVSLLGVFGKIVTIYDYNLAKYNKPVFALYFIIIVVYFIFIGPISLIKKYKLVSTIEKSQIKYIIVGYLIAIISALTASGLNGLVGKVSNFTFTGLVSITIVFAIMSSYAMARYRLLDIKVVIKRGLIYIISLIVTLAIYTYVALLLRTTIENYWNITPGRTSIVLIALVALGFPPLKMLVEKAINSLFKGKKSIDLAVKELREAISRETDLEKLVKIISLKIKEYLGVEIAKLFILNHKEQRLIYENDDSNESIDLQNNLIKYFEKYNEPLIYEEIPHLLEERQGKFEKETLQKAEKEMKKFNASLVLPFNTEEEVFALALLDQKKDKSTFTIQDVKFLVELREQAGITLANAVLYQEAVERITANTDNNQL
ncbi:MAG: hypothetical protein WCV50_02540 [Patescibacteria group bacterium]|jgi:hypothetical protein